MESKISKSSNSTTEYVTPILPPTLNRRATTLKEYALLLGSKAIKEICPLNDLVSHEGNKKVPATTCIFNFSSATDCASAKLGLCAACKAGIKCYAKKAEYDYYPLVLPYRRRQESFWKQVTAEQFVTQFLLLNSTKKQPFDKIRFSESGDFHNQAEVQKAERIAFLLNRFGIKVYCYTSRKDLDFSRCKHIIISGSNFMKNGVSNIFKIIKNKKDKPKGYSICPGSCVTCDWCSIRGKKICVKAH